MGEANFYYFTCLNVNVLKLVTDLGRDAYLVARG